MAATATDSTRSVRHTDTHSQTRQHSATEGKPRECSQTVEMPNLRRRTVSKALHHSYQNHCLGLNGLKKPQQQQQQRRVRTKKKEENQKEQCDGG